MKDRSDIQQTATEGKARLSARLGARFATSQTPSTLQIRSHPWAASFVGALCAAVISLILAGPVEAVGAFIGVLLTLRVVLWAIAKGFFPTGQPPPFP